MNALGDLPEIHDPAAETGLFLSLPRRTMEAVVERGWLDEEVAEEALRGYQESDSSVTLASYLVERGLVSLEQVAELEAAVPEAVPPVRPIVTGARFSGCEIDRKLGQGGMGTVYLARREPAGDDVVVKFLAAEYVRNPTWRARFLREAIVARRIDHPNVVRVHAVEVEGEQPHLVMELVQGADLEERLEQGPLPPLEVARIGRDVALGLAAAHAQGVIHRDVKPGNVRLTPDGQVKILDFGLAKLVETDDGVSLAGQILGTPWYMAPEQWGEHGVDARADVFALGATLYHLVTGQPPFNAARPMSIMRRAINGRCPRPSELRADLPLALELAILRMLAVDRRARYQDAEACVAALEAVLRGEPVEVPCLYELAEDGRPARQHPLVPRSSYMLGRSDESDVALVDMRASRTHARIRLTPTGYKLTDLGSSGGTFVNEARVEEVTLKPQDVIRCGETRLRFDDGGVLARRQSSSWAAPGGRLDVTTLPEPFIDSLAAAKDRRIVIALLERMPLEALDARVAASRDWLRLTFGDGALAEQAGSQLRERLLLQRKAAAKLLFAITFEGLRDDCDAWLSWWGEKHADYPPQLGPQRLRPRIRLRLLAGGEGAVELSERHRATLGRGVDCDVQLQERSVSRRHATILRLHQHLMIRDEGSRFGTLVNERPVASAFLEPGDRVRLANVELLCESDDPVRQPPRTSDGLTLIDPDLFDVLCGLEHPAVAQALARFVDFAADLDWVDRQAAELFDDAAAIRACAQAVRQAYDQQAARARELLPRLVTHLPDDPAGWSAAIEARADGLSLQVLPVGWLQPSA